MTAEAGPAERGSADPGPAERYVSSLDPIGWNFGLTRIAGLVAALGDPQRSFRTVHVVGTNGKSSVTRMTAALASAAGLRSASYLSPHINSWRERILIGGEPVSEEAFAEAVDIVREAAAEWGTASPGPPGPAGGGAPGDGPITQFELITAVAFVAFGRAGVEFAAIESGLGGRLDATNVIPSSATALTSVALDHTDLLGDTVEQIAAEKLDVLRPGTALVTGRLPPAVAELARRHAADRDCRLISEPVPPGDLAALVPAGYQRRNLGVAAALLDAATGALPAPAPDQAEPLRAALVVPGRVEQIAIEPLTLIDAAHNPEGAASLAEALPELTGSPTAVGCLAVLADKDAEGIARALSGALATAVVTEIPADAIAGSGRPGSESMPAPALAALLGEIGAEAEAVVPVTAALERAQALAIRQNLPLIVCGTHYLLGPARAVLGQSSR